MNAALKYIQQNRSLPYHIRRKIRPQSYAVSSTDNFETCGNEDETDLRVDGDGAILDGAFSDVSSVSDCDEDERFCVSDEDEMQSGEESVYESVTDTPGNSNLGTPIYPGCPVTVDESMKLFQTLQVVRNLDDVTVDAILKFLRAHLPKDAKYPKTLHHLKKRFVLPPETSELHYYCSRCDKELIELRCPDCNEEYDKRTIHKAGKYFVTFNLKTQFESLLQQPTIANALSETIEKKTSARLDPYDILCTFNSDGVPIFSSSNYSVWPFLITLQQLPVKLRSRNVLMAGIWPGSKPVMNLLLEKIVEKFNSLSSEALKWTCKSKAYYSRVYFTVCSADSPARCKLQGNVQFNGAFGCNWCYHEGVRVPKGKGFCRAYPAIDNVALRTDESYRSDANTGKHGVVKKSPLLSLRGFDMVSGFCVESMHAVCLGVVRTLTSKFLEDFGSDYYIGRYIKDIDKKLSKVKVSSEIVRYIRPISAYKHWKASEWLTWLWILPFILQGYLRAPYLNHISDLSDSVYLLCQSGLSENQINGCENKIQSFVVNAERLYGIESVGFNMHILTHLGRCYRNNGSLNETWAFAFEGFNGKIISFVHSPNNVPKQIARNYFMYNTVRKLEVLFASEAANECYGSLLFGKQHSQRLNSVHHARPTSNVPENVKSVIMKSCRVKSYSASSAGYINDQYFCSNDSKKRTNSVAFFTANIFLRIKMFYWAECTCAMDCECINDYVCCEVFCAQRIGTSAYMFKPRVELPSATEVHQIRNLKIVKVFVYENGDEIVLIKPPLLLGAF